METKEVEKLLSVSRSNIRFYEKEGLITPERGENNYRNYTASDIAMLKKIIVLRKLGFTVEEISAMQKGELLLSDAMTENIARLEREIEALKGALETAKALASEEASFDNLDEERYWDTITRAEKSGKEFVDICKDYLLYELHAFDRMWKYVFFHDFKKSRKKYGVFIASGILLLLCLLRGLSAQLIWKESFWEAFLYPLWLFLTGSLITLPIYLLRKKLPKAASSVEMILFIISFVILGFFVLLFVFYLIGGLIRFIF